MRAMEGVLRDGLVKTVFGSLLLATACGCQLFPNFYREDGPAVTMQLDSPTAADVKARFSAREVPRRDWPATTATPTSGIVEHYPLYMEDPFVDKGHGRTDETHPGDVYRLGWEDWVAFPYSPARFTGNWIMLPVSFLVTPACTVMESDGHVSKQALGYDHDAVPVRGGWVEGNLSYDATQPMTATGATATPTPSAPTQSDGNAMTPTPPPSGAQPMQEMKPQ